MSFEQSKRRKKLVPEEAGRRLVPGLAELPKAAADAVRWYLANHPKKWGPVRDGAEAWAVQRARQALDAVAGRMALAELAELEARLEEVKAAADADAIQRLNADRSLVSFSSVDGGLSVASAAVLEEAGRLAAGWPRLDAMREALLSDGAGAWDDGDDGRPALALRFLSDALAWAWNREVVRSKSARPATARVVAEDVLTLMAEGKHGQLDLFEREALLSARGKVLGRFDISAVPVPAPSRRQPAMTPEMARAMAFESTQRGLMALQTVPGQRLFNELLFRGHEAFEANPALLAETAPIVTFDGGWAAVADVVMPGKKDTRILKDIGNAGCAFRFEYGGLRASGLWTYAETLATRGRRASVSFTLGAPLRPRFIYSLSGASSDDARRARQLVPALRHEPPVGGLGRPNEAGALWSLSRLFVLVCVGRAEEMAEEGGIVLDETRWRAMAKRAGVPEALMPKVIDSWLEGESERAPALLKRIDGSGVNGRWTLADAHILERTFIEEGGRRRLLGRDNGRAATARKRAAVVANLKKARNKRSGKGA